jgi:hypothetical protein
MTQWVTLEGGQGGSIELPQKAARGVEHTNTVYRVKRDPQVCDFCADPYPVTTYLCATFIWNKDAAVPAPANGAWAACEVCADLIDDEDWEELADRAFDRFCEVHNLPLLYQPELRREIEELHELFRRHIHRPS